MGQRPALADAPLAHAGFHAALALNGIEMEDRVLTIKRAKAKAADAGKPAVGRAPPAPLPLDTSSRVVYVGNLSWEVDEESLSAAFEVRLRASSRGCAAAQR